MALSLVQSASNTGGVGSSSVTVTLGSPTTAGNCLVVSVGTLDGVTPVTVSGITLGGAAGNFAQAAGLTETDSISVSVDCETWTDQNCAGGQTSIVVTLSNTVTAVEAWAMEWSGLLKSAAVDKTHTGGGTTGTSWSSGSSGTLTITNELIVGAVMVRDGPGITLTAPGAPWTELTQLTTGSNEILAVGYQVVSATTAQTYNGTTNLNAFNSAAIVTLKGLTNVTGTLSVAMAPMKSSATGTETIPGTLSVAMAPLKMSATGTAAYVYIPQGLTTFGSGGGDRTAALWDQARTGEWQQAPGYGPVTPGSVPIISGSPAKLVGRGYTGELAEPAHYTGPEWVPAIPYEPPPPAPPDPAGPGIRERLRKIGAELYRIGGEIRPVSPYS
jgi:hypothetical protein